MEATKVSHGVSTNCSAGCQASAHGAIPFAAARGTVSKCSDWGTRGAARKTRSAIL